MSNKIKYNLKNVHAAIQKHSEDGGYEYETPKAIPGAVNLSLDAEGETSPFYGEAIFSLMLSQEKTEDDRA